MARIRGAGVSSWRGEQSSIESTTTCAEMRPNALKHLAVQPLYEIGALHDLLAGLLILLGSRRPQVPVMTALEGGCIPVFASGTSVACLAIESLPHFEAVKMSPISNNGDRSLRGD